MSADSIIPAAPAAPGASVTHLVDQLVCLLNQTMEVQERVHDAITEKLRAMRRADAAGIVAATEREAEAAGDAANLDRCRREVSARLCAAVGAVAANARGDVPLRKLAERLPDVEGRRVEAAAERLRGLADRVAEANRTVEMAGLALLAHFRTLAEAFFDNGDANTYTPTGDLGRPSEARIFSATV